jgi:hypothetical protein
MAALRAAGPIIHEFFLRFRVTKQKHVDAPPEAGHDEKREQS